MGQKASTAQTGRRSVAGLDMYWQSFPLAFSPLPNLVLPVNLTMSFDCAGVPGYDRYVSKTNNNQKNFKFSKWVHKNLLPSSAYSLLYQTVYNMSEITAVTQ